MAGRALEQIQCINSRSTLACMCRSRGASCRAEQRRQSHSAPRHKPKDPAHPRHDDRPIERHRHSQSGAQLAQLLSHRLRTRCRAEGVKWTNHSSKLKQPARLFLCELQLTAAPNKRQARSRQAAASVHALATRLHSFSGGHQ